MTVDRKRLFEQLNPPPGGIERFRARLSAPASSTEAFLPRARISRPGSAFDARNRGLLRLVGVTAGMALIAAVVTRLPLGSAPPERATPAAETEQLSAGSDSLEAPPAAEPTQAPTGAAARSDSLLDAPELDWLLGRASAPVEVSVTVGGEEADVVELASSDPRIRVYMMASNGED